MSDLREGAIEAAAKGIAGDWLTIQLAPGLAEKIARAALDALLDYLEANADEWWRQKVGGPTVERGLIAALRGEGTEKGTE